MSKFVDSTGEIFGKILVLRYDPPGSKKFVIGKCECGTLKRINAKALRAGHTRSCGCSRTEAHTTHGESKRRTAEYNTWANMIQRCQNPKHGCWDRYGGRGIEVCERWRSYDNFLADLGRRPSPKHSLDRFPNNDGNYAPGNCRWATSSEQRKNSSTAVLVSHNGVTKNFTDWCRDLGLLKSTVRNRVVMFGATVKEALGLEGNRKWRAKNSPKYS